MFVNETGAEKTFDPAFINTRGQIVKPYSKLGDLVSFTRVIGEDTRTFLDAEIVNVVWDKAQIVIDVETTSPSGISSIHKFFYSPEGKLVKYIAPSGKAFLNNLDKMIDTSDTIKITPEMLAELPDYSTGQTSKVGDKIIYKMDYVRDGEQAVSIVEADVVELEELGYQITGGPSGTYTYTGDVPLYRVKIKYEKTYNDQVTVRIVHNIVDANGKVVANINDKGQAYDVVSSNIMYLNLRSDRVKGQYAVPNEVTAKELVKRAVIKPGSIVDVIDLTPGSTIRKSKLMYLDAADMQLKELKDVYTNVQAQPLGFNIDSTNFFTVFNEAQDPGTTIAATRASAVPLPKGSGVGNIDIRDRYIYHSNFQNKAGLISRLKYGGGSMVEFITDVDGKIDPEVKKMIDQSIEKIKKKRDEEGLTPVFSKAGYGQYMIGADDTTGKMFTDKEGNKIGTAVAPATFKYLSTRLLEEFGYINPNFVKEAEGVQEVVRVVKQPITDEEYHDLMNKCFV